MNSTERLIEILHSIIVSRINLSNLQRSVAEVLTDQETLDTRLDKLEKLVESLIHTTP